MAQANVRWEKGSFYIVASRIPTTTVFEGNPYLSFFICGKDDGSEGRWITVDTISGWRSRPFPSNTLSTFPWPDEVGRVPHAVARILRDREEPSASRTAQAFDLALYRAWTVHQQGAFIQPGPENYEWFLEAIRTLNNARLLLCTNELALREAVWIEAAKPMEGAQDPVVVDVSRWCEQGPGPVNLNADWGLAKSPPPTCNIL